MSQEIEIEFKNLLTKEEFLHLKEFLVLDDAMFKKQENHYFDTTGFSLKDMGCALRIRVKQENFELTLKEPLSEGLLETSQILTPEEAHIVLQGGTMVEGPVLNQLKQLNIPIEEIQYFGSLTTERAEKEYKGGLIVLDYSYYLNQFDYELEYEVKDSKIGKNIFDELLSQLQIPVRKTDNKIRRFYNAKFKHMNEENKNEG